MTGTLFGVGLGPGDPELITRKAERIIRQGRVIAYPKPIGGSSFARSIAEDLISADAVNIPINIPMLTDEFPVQQIYDQAALTIKEHLESGSNVVVLCQGDPFFYGSFMYLFVRFADSQFPIEIVPGVSSLNGCSAAAKTPLCARMKPLKILPAPMSEDKLLSELECSSGAVIVKIGRHLNKVRRVLTKLGQVSNAIYVSHASLPQQIVLQLKDAPEEAPYFSTVLVPGQYPYEPK